MKIEQRLGYPLKVKPEMCSLNMGSMNFSFHPVAERITNWRYDWEKPKVEGRKTVVFKNTFADIEYILRNLGEGGTRFELECYDVGHLYNLAYFVDREALSSRRSLFRPFSESSAGSARPGKSLRDAIDRGSLIRTG